MQGHIRLLLCLARAGWESGRATGGMPVQERRPVTRLWLLEHNAGPGTSKNHSPRPFGAACLTQLFSYSSVQVVSSLEHNLCILVLSLP